MYRNVLIPVDGSAGSQKAVDYGVDLAEVYDAAVHLVYVVDESVYDHYAQMDAIENAEEALERHGEEVLAEARAQAGDAGLQVFEHVVRGAPHEAIVDCAEEADADLVVMGTERKSGEYRRLIGSVTERVVRACDRPVQVVKADV
jgi:nucleotide-binding universal stress UspA family protein